MVSFFFLLYSHTLSWWFPSFFFCILYSLFSWWFPSLILDVFLLTPSNFLYSFPYSLYTPAKSFRQYKNYNVVTFYFSSEWLQWIQVKTSMFSISLTWLNILHITGEKQIIPRTHIHSYPSNLLKIYSAQASKIFYWQASLCSYKERTNHVINYLER